MVSIRFKRIGKRHQPTYRIVVAKKGSKMNGAYVEDLGFYNPHSKEVGLNTDRVKYWVSVGAQPTDSVHNLFVSQKLIEAEKRRSHKKSKKSEPEAKAEEAVTEEVKTEA
ncbi:MAG: 30S ribosomal protein S16 [Candidatus Harrisonbacteria bacterium CG10_big_fil_rev_8_21_14_0_10_38_8]|uniref:Small ribosomal subunit protein bS16 n=1 Tax=Candidatus Harrisonbacteria bacterium CG10_big_fil_rev_8_21_14_0_10_38_8 TaxID=1974582 RepID=A0A2M6WKT4_9BACT|nr:MAG: 30S ribosomal protein S16 [Candidatus Harrisonbacteria bacterium CG10_big_fil_rev_8_21_14_0_10_38_8]